MLEYLIIFVNYYGGISTVLTTSMIWNSLYKLT
jgi:hypothetical protein